MLLVSSVVFHLKYGGTFIIVLSYDKVGARWERCYSNIVRGINAERISLSTGRNEGKEQYVNYKCRSNKNR